MPGPHSIWTKLDKGYSLSRQHQWNWDGGWLQFRAQDETAKLWVREGVQVLGIACWHVGVLERTG